ncbi:DUF6284 family protein [Streptomyces ipomoeae]|uniref:DUF6284 family protein n=1 Tax=Streptomyces ipomoeae TaxID=103232 RepID=UPI0011479ECC|nr:DUF6284 family protein [Streptomyces ipomoeae]MDX2939063.1 DUF6284 family protein [Streptomyces ipomoeae]TQE27377.1 hypothetical protein SipoB123_12115 [Streptomyces ipomoeae]
MWHIGAVRAAVTRDGFDGPTAAELNEIELEMPLIEAEVDLLDARIKAMDRPANEVDARRVRRARNRVLAARRDLVNRTVGVSLPGGAA